MMSLLTAQWMRESSATMRTGQRAMGVHAVLQPGDLRRMGVNTSLDDITESRGAMKRNPNGSDKATACRARLHALIAVLGIVLASARHAAASHCQGDILVGGGGGD